MMRQHGLDAAAAPVQAIDPDHIIEQAKRK